MNTEKNYIVPLTFVLDVDCEGMLCASPEVAKGTNHQGFSTQKVENSIWA